jgi:hypothetical protein
MANERRREPIVNPQFLNEVVTDNDLISGYCRNPFTPDIMAQELPVGFQFAKKLDDYDGTKDPHQHVQNFERIVTFQGIREQLACRAFSLTLTEAAGRWFNELPSNSIGS